jgi:CheY-like chemotaxis protein
MRFEGDERELAFPPSWAAKRILLVQENEMVRRVVGGTLERHGYLVIEATTTEDAFQHARRGGRIDVVLSEFAKGEVSGPELLLRLRRFVPTIRAIFMSSGATPESRKPLARGATVLRAPFGTSELLSAVREAVDGCSN